MSKGNHEISTYYRLCNLRCSGGFKSPNFSCIKGRNLASNPTGLNKVRNLTGSHLLVRTAWGGLNRAAAVEALRSSGHPSCSRPSPLATCFCSCGHPAEGGRGKRIGRQVLILRPQDKMTMDQFPEPS